jgi:hypothetical protein
MFISESSRNRIERKMLLAGTCSKCGRRSVAYRSCHFSHDSLPDIMCLLRHTVFIKPLFNVPAQTGQKSNLELRSQQTDLCPP